MNGWLGNIAIAGLLALPLAGANEAATGSEPGLGPGGLVAALRANGAEILPLGARGGLEGYFVTPARGGGYGLYVTGDGHAVAGLLYGPDGRELTGAQLAASRPAAAVSHGAEARAPETLGPRTFGPQTLGPQTAPPAVTAHAEPRDSVAAPWPASIAGLFERSAAAFGFTLGQRGPVVVLLGDATCSWSRAAAARLGRAALDGRLQLRVVPVAVLGGAAARRAAAIAASPDPARAWFGGGGAPGRAGAERIARNNALLDQWGASAVPLIAWRTRDGAVGHRIGDIDEVATWLRDTLRVGDTRAGGEP
ncbi:MAG: hypothetical protein OXP75_02905 [Rhodospirillales bacterium]|nr:hypothetical protein [Rhodospirillales bacterium]